MSEIPIDPKKMERASKQQAAFKARVSASKDRKALHN